VSVVESVLDSPKPILLAQQWAARGEAVAELKADGVDYEERMELLEDVTWPQPLAELLGATYTAYRHTHPWLGEDALAPKSIVREMWEQAMSFTELVSRYGLTRSEGVVLRYLSDAYRTLRQTVPDAYRTPELDELIDWLGETIRQTDSSLVDEWEALVDPDAAAATAAHHAGSPDAPRPPRPLSANVTALRTMVRRAMWRRVELAARDDITALCAVEQAGAALTEPPRPVVMTAAAWDEALGAYWDEHDQISVDGDARGPAMLQVTSDARFERPAGECPRRKGQRRPRRRAPRMADPPNPGRPSGRPRLGDRGLCRPRRHRRSRRTRAPHHRAPPSLDPARDPSTLGHKRGGMP
jgi:hypothetical protein